MFWDGGGSAEANNGVRMACDAQPGISPRLVLAKPLAPAQGSGAGGALPSPSDTAAYGEQPPTAATTNRNGGGILLQILDLTLVSYQIYPVKNW